MNCGDIIKTIEETYPKHYAMNWDNVGLLVGSRQWKAEKILVTLDVTNDVVSYAIKENVDLIVAHHPMIFSPMKFVTDDDFIGKRILNMIQNGIACYAMHTNYDVIAMTDACGKALNLVGGEVLEVTCMDESENGKPMGIGKVYQLESDMTVSEYADIVKDSFSLDTVKIFGDLQKKVGTIAISPGSGKSMVEIALEKDVQLLITGDIDHHTGLDAVDQGMIIMDAGHYGLEQAFVPDMSLYLKKNLKQVEVLKMPASNPFQVI